jgi:hypothetical protein
MIDRHLGNIGILAKFAPKVAADGGDGIRERAREKMKQGFFFDRINMAGDNFAINQRMQHAGPVFANAAFPPAACFYDAAMAAQVAFDLLVFQRFIQVRFHILIAPISILKITN